MKEKEISQFDSLIKDSIKVDNAVLHAACLFAGGRTESTLTQIKVPGLELYWSPLGLVFRVKTQVGIIPPANVKILYLK